jgi:hypothetical protein
MARKIIQIATAPFAHRAFVLFALANDGTVWQLPESDGDDVVEWMQVVPLPDDDEESTQPEPEAEPE